MWRRIDRGVMLAGVVLAASAFAQTSTPLARGDVEFLKQAAHAGLAEVAGSKVAVEKAVNTQVRGFAQQMVDDHTRSHEELKALAASKGVTLPTEPSIAQRARVKMLDSKDGGSFDRRYAAHFGVTAHQDAIRLYVKAASDAQDSDVRAYAAKTLPILQHHLQMAHELKETAKKEGNAKAAGDKKQ
jgi:putative membrane protein